jgi:AsmA family
MATNAQNRPLSDQPRPVLRFERRRRSRRGGRVAAVLLVLGLIALIAPSFVNLNRFRDRLANTLSATLGREVTVQNVGLRLLPRPGFTLSGLSIADDPSFGSEPMIRSNAVTASLRISSIWRGRLEIASLSLSEPSLNLVRDRNGRWNIEALLERATHIPSAPTGKTRAENRPRFPYIEAEDGRINLKFEQEKKVYALAGTDFALWLANEDEWNMRLAGQPIRSDANLSNTGTLKAEGSFKRATDLGETPMKIDVRLEDAQLGQLTHLLYGYDRGWRGAVRFGATLNGTPADFTLTTDARVADFRRYDIASTDNLSLQAHCDAHYRNAGNMYAGNVRNFFLNLQCHSPVQAGQLVLHAELSPGEARPLLDVIAVSIPVSSMTALMRHAKKDVAEDLSAAGTFSGNLGWRDGELTGSGVASGVRLRSNTLKPPVTLGNIILSVQEQWPARPGSERMFVRVLPFSVFLGGPTPVTVQGSFSRSDYRLAFSGVADPERLATMFDTLGLPLPAGAVSEGSGLAKVDFELSGLWSGFAAPKSAGFVRLQSASLTRAGIKQE